MLSCFSTTAAKVSLGCDMIDAVLQLQPLLIYSLSMLLHMVTKKLAFQNKKLELSLNGYEKDSPVLVCINNRYNQLRITGFRYVQLRCLSIQSVDGNRCNILILKL